MTPANADDGDTNARGNAENESEAAAAARLAKWAADAGTTLPPYVAPVPPAPIRIQRAGGVTDPLVIDARAADPQNPKALMDDGTRKTVGSGVTLPFQGAHAYKAGEGMTSGGQTWVRNNDGTSRATFDATEQALWSVLPIGSARLYNVTASPPDSLGADGEYAIGLATVNGVAGTWLWGPKGSVSSGLWGAPQMLGGGQPINVGYGVPGEVLPQPAGLFPTRADRSAGLNRGYFVRYRPARARALIKIGFELVTASTGDDPCDVGLYTAALVAGVPTLTRVWSLGSTNGLLNGAAGLVQVACVQNLDPTLVYYLAFAFGTLTSTGAVIDGRSAKSITSAKAFGTNPPDLIAGYRDAVFPLPASIAATTPLTATTIQPALYPTEV